MMETVIPKLASFNFLNPSSAFRRFEFRSFSSSSISVSTSTDSVSLGHITRPDFPILHQEINGTKKLVYLDNAATSQKPFAVLKALQNYYEAYNSNVHRGIHYLSAKATDEYELARKKVASFINASDSREVVFTRNATEAINLVAYSWGMSNLKQGDEIILTIAEHHSAIVPWQLIAQKTGAILKFLDLNKDEIPNVDKLKETLSTKTKLVVVHHVSNMLGRFPVTDATANAVDFYYLMLDRMFYLNSCLYFLSLSFSFNLACTFETNARFNIWQRWTGRPLFRY